MFEHCAICNATLEVTKDKDGKNYYGCLNRNEGWHYNRMQERRDMEDKTKVDPLTGSPDKAVRNPVDVRYDIIYAEFIKMMAKIGAVGAAKYGDFNWHKSRLTGANGPVNHIHKHLTSYEMEEQYDHKQIGDDHKIHLAAVAFNAMMEYWYCENLVEDTKFYFKNVDENKIPGGV